MEIEEKNILPIDIFSLIKNHKSITTTGWVQLLPNYVHTYCNYL